jgi:hypothetical protein
MDIEYINTFADRVCKVTGTDGSTRIAVIRKSRENDNYIHLEWPMKRIGEIERNKTDVFIDLIERIEYANTYDTQAWAESYLLMNNIKIR